MARTGFAFPLSFHTSLVVEVAQAAEAQGYASFWLTEGGGKDAISQLAYVAAHTERIGLATGIITIFSRTPALVAQTAHGMAQLSGGRFILGLGTGHKASVEDVQGLPFSKPISRMEDYVAILRGILREGRVQHEGKAVSVSNFEFRIGADEPLNDVPVYIATLGGPGAQLAGRVAEGVVPLLASPMGIGALREDIVNGARSAGRELSDIDIAPFIIAVAGSDSALVEKALRANVGRYARMPFYQKMLRVNGFGPEVTAIQEAQANGDDHRIPNLLSDQILEELTLSGPADRWRSTLQRYRAAGATQPIVYAAPAGDPRESLLKAVRTLTSADLA